MNNTPGFRRYFTPDDDPILLIMLAKILIHFWTNWHDHLFVDEFYYIACSKHLDFGYVDHPPLVALIAAVTRFCLGDSLFALRLPAVFAGAFIIFLAGRLTRELGGGRYAQILSALAVFAAPIYFGISGYYSMNVFDQMFWLLGFYALVKIIQTNSPAYWIGFGVITGMGLENKLSILFFGFGLVIAMALTPQRRWFLNPWFWISGATAGLIFLPHVLWQFAYGWPTREFIQNATQYKNLPMTPLQFLQSQIMDLNPFLFILWGGGLFWFLFNKHGKPFRLFGWLYISVFILLITKNGKPYYLSPAYTVLFAGGAIAFERFIHHWRWEWLKPVIMGFVLISGILTIPFSIPILPIPAYIAYSQALGIQPSTSERKELGPLPQHFADRQGWEKLVSQVASVYNRLTPQEKSQCIIVGSSYGIAGAMDYYGKQYELPAALSGHNSYYFWGPGDRAGTLAVVVGYSKKDIEKTYKEVEEISQFDDEYAMPYRRHMPIYLCRQPKLTIQEAWPQVKFFI